MSKKTFEFHGEPGEYFLVFLVTLIGAYIPLFGWAYIFNYMNRWLADNVTINGKHLVYKAEYWEVFKFLTVNILLVFVTFGIYTFWFVPKQYRFMADHVHYVD